MTGVQTCALPISPTSAKHSQNPMPLNGRSPSVIIYLPKADTGRRQLTGSDSESQSIVTLYQHRGKKLPSRHGFVYLTDIHYYKLNFKESLHYGRNVFCGRTLLRKDPGLGSIWIKNTVFAWRSGPASFGLTCNNRHRVIRDDGARKSRNS